jgi:Flp pilus assembly protein TadB
MSDPAFPESDMTDNGFDKAQARAALDAAEQARTAGRRAARRWARRYLLGFGAVSAGSVLAVWAVSVWVSSAWWGVWYALLAVLFAVWLRRQPVRAVPRRMQLLTILAWSMVFGLTMAVGNDYPAAYPIGAAAGFSVWAAAAWWVGR